MEDGSVLIIREMYNSDSELEKVFNKVKKIIRTRENTITASTSNFVNGMVDLLSLKKITVFFMNGIYLSISCERFQQMKLC